MNHLREAWAMLHTVAVKVKHYPTDEVGKWIAGDSDGSWEVSQFARKLHPSKVDALVEDIKRNGVRRPLHAAAPIPGQEDTPILWHGHHRAAAAIKAGLPSIPVIMHEPVYEDGEWFHPTLPALDDE